MHRSWTALSICMVLTCSAALAHAQGEEPEFAESFFVATDETDSDELNDAIDMCGNRFRQPLMATGNFIERASPEIARTVSECVNDFDASFARECDLAVARSTVDLVFLVSARDTSQGLMFEVTAVSPMIAGAVWASDAITDDADPLLGARQICGELGEAFVAHHAEDGIERPHDEPQGDADEVAADTRAVDPAHVGDEAASHRHTPETMRSAPRTILATTNSSMSTVSPIPDDALTPAPGLPGLSARRSCCPR